MARTSKQKQFHDLLARSGCVITGEASLQLHHLEGREFKIDKKNVGHWLVIPLTFRLHDVSSNDPLNVTHHKNNFYDAFGTGYELFYKAVENAKNINPKANCFPPEWVMESVKKYYEVNEDLTDWMALLGGEA